MAIRVVLKPPAPMDFMTPADSYRINHWTFVPRGNGRVGIESHKARVLALAGPSVAVDWRACANSWAPTRSGAKIADHSLHLASIRSPLRLAVLSVFDAESQGRAGSVRFRRCCAPREPPSSAVPSETWLRADA